MYTRILVPLDGSETAERGLREALKLASDPQTRLRLYHIVDEYPLMVEMAASQNFERALEDLKLYGAKVLERARLAAAAVKVDADTALAISKGARAAEMITQEALASGCDLVVIGTHGRRGFKRLALGSTAEQVARTCPVPVLLVHADGPFVPGVRHDVGKRGENEALGCALP